ncbi:MAG: PAS domain-containing sensor histidine kinase [Desulfuromonadales bacterium]|nr:PAS domain-containing sensor histidine kinase [Desulfuromonadales bacterium]
MSLAENLVDLTARADIESICADAELLANAEFSSRLTEIVPCIVLILNQQRQIVFSNRRLLTLLGVTSDDDILGKRPGELFGCVNSDRNVGGCGNSAHCRECGALRTLLEFQGQTPTAGHECRLLTRDGEAYEFRVQASPYQHAGKDFTVFSLYDISDKKRREALEQTFFHDLNNHLNIIMCYSEVLNEVKDTAALAEYCKIIQTSGKELCEEIAAHRRLLQAERGALSLNIAVIESLTVLGDTMKIFCEHEQWQDRKVVVDMRSEIVGILTDRTLLLRVLGNMLKNALEATSSGDEIRLACYQDEPEQVIFSVHNPGHIPQSVQLQLFQRSFSTKGEGRGIGTYSMKLFGEKYLKGEVWFVSNEDEGTTFNFSLPVEHPACREKKGESAP